MVIMRSQDGYVEYSGLPAGGLVAAFMAVCLVGVVAAAVRGARAGRGRRPVAVVTLGWSVLWFAVAWYLVAPARATVDGATVECASPAAASTTHGVPDDSSMSDAAVACRTAGRWRLGLLVVLAAGGTGAAVAALHLAPRSRAAVTPRSS